MDKAKRIAAGGIAALTPKEVCLTGCVVAFLEQLGKVLPLDPQATIIVRHTDAYGAACNAVIDRTGATLRAMVAAGELTPATDARDLALLVSAVATMEAEKQVQELAELLH
jgi:hypothetical protein